MAKKSIFVYEHLLLAMDNTSLLDKFDFVPDKKHFVRADGQGM